MKKKQRKSYTAAFKVKIALEAIKGQRTINEIATHYGVHPNMVTQWKKQAIESLPDVFSTRRERDAQGEEALKAELYQQIGPNTTNKYATLDLEMKRKALSKIKPLPGQRRVAWRKNRTILDSVVPKFRRHAVMMAPPLAL